jgi:C4-dicarboxylate transporter, DctM subunit
MNVREVNESPTMYAQGAVTVEEAIDLRPTAQAPWLRAFDDVCIAFLNVALVAEFFLVFVNTVARVFHGEIVQGLEETARLYLVSVAFLGGGVAYGRGRFMAVTVFVERLPPLWRHIACSLVEWTVVLLTVLIGGASIPLQIMNSGEHTALLGIGYVWMTVPMTIGCLLFVLHAGRELLRRPRPVVLGAGLAVLAATLAVVLASGGDWVNTPVLYLLLVGSFVFLIAIGLPVGFVLGAVGILYVWETGSAPLIAIASTAQRGVGGFIFLALPFFILTGFIMDKGGIGERIVALLTALLGHLRGGLLQVTIVGMYVASGISGSKAADMAAVGIPMNESFRRQGYDQAEAAAVLAASAAMGESIPPSIAILALGSVTSVSTGALFLAGLLPAATIAVCLMAVVYFRALHSGWKPGPRATMRTRLLAARGAVIPMLLPVLLIGGIVGGIGTPTEMSSFAVVLGLLVAVGLYREVGPREFWNVLTEANLLGGMIFFTFAGATLFSWALSLEGVPNAIANTLEGFGAHVFLPAVIAITIVLGALLESIVTVIILGPLLLPVALHLGVDPLQYGIVLIEAFGIGSIIPPVGLALYIACAICGTEVHRTARPVAVYLVVLCAGLLLVASVPWITVVLPHAAHFTN